jgi:outer membrane protein OmpA-like peptidoglycan-associated protein
LLGLLTLFLIGALVTAPSIEDEVGNGVAKTLAVAGVWVEALTVDGQNVTAHIGMEGPDRTFLRRLAEATTCDTWVGKLKCPVAVALERTTVERLAAEEMVAPEQALVVQEPDAQAEMRHDREACNEALRDTLADTSVHFRASSAQIDAASADLLERLADLVNECPGFVTVEGHTDSEGHAQMNAALSQARANAVRNALIRLGVDGARLRAVGYGESRPVFDNDTAEGRAANQRIVISIDEPE